MTVFRKKHGSIDRMRVFRCSECLMIFFADSDEMLDCPKCHNSTVSRGPIKTFDEGIYLIASEERISGH